LAERGVDVEILSQGGVRAEETSIVGDGVLVRRFPTVVGPVRFSVAPGLWERLRRLSDELDLLDVHTDQVPLALASMRTAIRRKVFTPRAPLDRLVSWPYGHAMKTVVSGASQIVCASIHELELFCRRFPFSEPKTTVVPIGVDHDAIRSATPLACSDQVMLIVGRLEQNQRIDRAIAAMAALDPTFRLVVVGDGPARHQLAAHAADLRVSSRVQFVGSVPDGDLYRWLRTARVVMALAESDSSGLQVTEAIAAGGSIVASDIPVHREAAQALDPRGVLFVSPTGSPLEVADALQAASRQHHAVDSPLASPSWQVIVDRMWQLYRELIGDSPPVGLIPRFGRPPIRADAFSRASLPKPTTD
jgi:glycosyltransferase involved in cell wall biosynthesis